MSWGTGLGKGPKEIWKSKECKLDSAVPPTHRIRWDIKPHFKPQGLTSPHWFQCIVRYNGKCLCKYSKVPPGTAAGICTVPNKITCWIIDETKTLFESPFFITHEALGAMSLVLRAGKFCKDSKTKMALNCKKKSHTQQRARRRS